MDSRMRFLYILVMVAGMTLLLLFTVLSPSGQYPAPANFTVTGWRPDSRLGLDFSAWYEVEETPYRIHQHRTPYLRIKTGQTYNNKCSKRIELPQYEAGSEGSTGQMFFLETSGRSWLTPREACALESAAKFSNLRVNILLTSPFLDTFDNSTCYLYMTVENVIFYTINLAKIFSRTPLEGFEKRKSLIDSQYRSVHLSDSLRLALIYKAGGFYSDLDSVTLRDLSKLKNVIGATFKDKNTLSPHLANGEFHLQRNHRLLLHTMNLLARQYRGELRVEVGPRLITEAVKTVYNVSQVGGLHSADLTVMPPNFFYPAKSYEVRSLWQENPKSFSFWSDFLANSSMVHFYGSQSNEIVVQKNPSHELYAVIGPRYCPISYWSSKHF